MTADRKRFGLLCGALAVGMLLWGRMIVLTNVPRTAVADETGHASAADSSPRRPVPGGSEQGRAAILVHLDASPRRDPFVISDEHFPKPQAEAITLPDQGKSSANVAESEEVREARLMAALQEACSRLRLEAVMMGSSTRDPMVVIDGRTYRRGEFVAASSGRAAPAGGSPESEIRFQLVEVEHRSAVLEFDGRRFELKMANAF